MAGWRSQLGIALVMGTLGLGAACGEEDAVGEIGQVSGTVRDEDTGARIENARVTFTSDTLESGEARTNEDGEYTILLESRSLNGRIQAERPGYELRVVSVFLDDADVRIDVNLRRAD